MNNFFNDEQDNINKEDVTMYNQDSEYVEDQPQDNTNAQEVPMEGTSEKDLAKMAGRVGYLIMIRELSEGSKGREALTKAYFGEGRYKGNPTAKTSFHNKLKAAIADKIVSQTAPRMPYFLGPVGKELLFYCQKKEISLDVKSQAQLRWEEEHGA